MAFTDVFSGQPTQQIHQSDALRRSSNIRPPASATWMAQSAGGLSPELLRAIMAARRFQMQNPPIADPKAVVSGVNYRRPL